MGANDGHRSVLAKVLAARAVDATKLAGRTFENERRGGREI
jgi:hypothetical protein